jgi:hypothetical protein
VRAFSRSCAAPLALALLMPVGAFAQTPTSPPAEEPLRDGVALGASLTPAWAGGLGFWPSVRVSTPLGRRIALDFDGGRMYPADNGYFSTRAFYAVQFRLLRAPRDDSGSTRFWILGPAFIRGSELDGDGNVTNPHADIGAIRIAYGGDRLYSNGMRTSAEIGVIGGGSSAPTGFYASLSVQWRPRR